MNILVAPASFKGSLSAVEAAQAIEQGIRSAVPQAEVVRMPLADGGEGTVEALVTATHGRTIKRTVTGPLGKPVEAEFGLLCDDVTAVVEMAQASGLPLVPPEQRNPLITTTRGTGELMAAALDAGCTKLIVGIGGSGTNDGGAGMAQALGAKLLDEQGQELPPGGAALAKLARVDVSGLDPRLARCQVLVACDVDNPLTGPHGASAVYGPQKGATPGMVAELEAALEHYASVIERDLGKRVRDIPGAGAAGGLGAGLMAFCNAQPRSGILLVMEAVGFEQYLEAADLVITGEGRVDAQSLHGKAVAGVGARAKLANVPVIALAGAVTAEPEQVAELGITAALPITDRPMAEREAIRRAGELLQAATERALQLLLVGQGLGSQLQSG